MQEAIQAYALDAPPPTAILPRQQRRLILSHLEKVLSGSQNAARQIPEILADVRVVKERSTAAMARGRAGALEKLTAKYDPEGEAAREGAAALAASGLTLGHVRAGTWRISSAAPA